MKRKDFMRAMTGYEPGKDLQRCIESERKEEDSFGMNKSNHIITKCLSPLHQIQRSKATSIQWRPTIVISWLLLKLALCRCLTAQNSSSGWLSCWYSCTKIDTWNYCNLVVRHWYISKSRWRSHST